MKCLNSVSIEVSDENDSNESNNKVVEEVKKQLWLSGPLVLVGLLQFGQHIISLMLVGHLGKLVLSGFSMASSFSSVTGFSLLIGMASALETLCGQSYGAKQYHLMGIHMQRGMIVLLLASIPIALIWANTKSLLILTHQDPHISEEAGLYARFTIPSIFAYALLQCLSRFLQTQNIVVPMIFCSGITTILHFPICWFLVFKSGLGSRGAALANSSSYWINVLLLVIYVKFSTSCQRSWTGLSIEALHNMINFLRLAVPSALMVCLEMWSFELMVLLSGLLPNPELDVEDMMLLLYF